jgi:hypothetical protein
MSKSTNALIADFMGLEKLEEGLYKVPFTEYSPIKVFDYHKEDPTYLTLNSGSIPVLRRDYELEYTNSRAALLPVIDRINSIEILPPEEEFIQDAVSFNVCISKSTVRILISYICWDSEKELSGHCKGTMLDNLVSSIVEFINFYNSIPDNKLISCMYNFH